MFNPVSQECGVKLGEVRPTWYQPLRASVHISQGEDSGIRVNSVAHRFTDTPMTAVIPPNAREAFIARQVIKRSMKPEELALLANYLNWNGKNCPVYTNRSNSCPSFITALLHALVLLSR